MTGRHAQRAVESHSVHHNVNAAIRADDYFFADDAEKARGPGGWKKHTKFQLGRTAFSNHSLATRSCKDLLRSSTGYTTQVRNALAHELVDGQAQGVKQVSATLTCHLHMSDETDMLIIPDHSEIPVQASVVNQHGFVYRVVDTADNRSFIYDELVIPPVACCLSKDAVTMFACHEEVAPDSFSLAAVGRSGEKNALLMANDSCPTNLYMCKVVDENAPPNVSASVAKTSRIMSSTSTGLLKR